MFSLCLAKNKAILSFLQTLSPCFSLTSVHREPTFLQHNSEQMLMVKMHIKVPHLLTSPYLHIPSCYLHNTYCVQPSFITHHMAQFRPSSSHQDSCNSFLTILHVCPSLSALNLVPSSKPSDGSHSPYNNVQIHCLRVFSLDVCPCSK